MMKEDIFDELIKMEKKFKTAMKKMKREEAIYLFIKEVYLFLIYKKILVSVISIDTKKQNSMTGKP